MSTNEKTVSKAEETKDKKAEVKAENKKEELALNAAAERRGIR